MQTAANSLGEAIAWTGEHWRELLIAGAATLALVKIYQWAATHFGPQDFTANGIAIGRAKAFDNRTLTLMLEQLDASLRAFNALSQNVAQNLGAFQEERSTELARRLKVAARANSSESPRSGYGALCHGMRWIIRWRHPSRFDLPDINHR
jgi:hypothetical protein